MGNLGAAHHAGKFGGMDGGESRMNDPDPANGDDGRC